MTISVEKPIAHSATPLPVARPRARKKRVHTGALVRTLGGWLFLVLLWEFVARVPLAGLHLIAAPSAIVINIGENAELYLRAFGITGTSALLGYLVGNSVAVALAVFVAMLPRSERIVLRMALVVYCLPLIALGPLLRLVFGLGEGPQITLAAIAVYYMTLVPLLVGLRAVPASWLDLVASYGRGRATSLFVVRFRACIPYLVSGLQVAVPAAFLGALVGEFTGAASGVGVLSIQALRGLDTDSLWALSALSAAVSVAAYTFVGWLGRRLTPEQPPIIMAAPANRGSGTGWRRQVRGFLEGAVVFVLSLALWVGFVRFFGLNPYFAKGPADVWEYLVTSASAPLNRTEIFDALATTAAVAIPGYFAGLILGVLVAATFDLAPSVRRTMTPVTLALRCVPIVAIAPLLVQMLGRGAVGMTVIVALMTFFPTLVACMTGLRQTPGQVIDVFDTYATSSVRTLVLARVPAMMPAFFSAARIAAPSAILAATVAEWLATGTGIGNLLAVTAATSRYDALWSTTVILTIVAVLVYWLIELVERAVLKVVAPEQALW
ncbi:ABC transporter permease subunit [Microbacterium sp. LRZ72]|uniref:ABC transporter permease n=1 Tax=Microbacterium sp. LRZ72 TaxID=2942481 RepID=UPI0029BC267D|nr:ABC transporter permease subunit [Microbacterium sp. LRZ72]MDX2377660.1 ABC transporter permease subunit [Microbacterium sp. LRZ72]